MPVCVWRRDGHSPRWRNSSETPASRERRRPADGRRAIAPDEEQVRTVTVLLVDDTSAARPQEGHCARARFSALLLSRESGTHAAVAKTAASMGERHSDCELVATAAITRKGSDAALSRRRLLLVGRHQRLT